MFILRTVSNKVESNNVIGDSYSFIDRFGNYEEFCSWFLLHFNRTHVADLDPESDDNTKNCYGFIVGPKIGTYPIYQTNHNYIMTGDGRTFANISLK